MSTLIDAVVNTQNRKERKRLTDYLGVPYSFDNYNGVNLVLVTSNGQVGYLGVICARNLVDDQGLLYFRDVNSYIKHCEKLI